jgi:hypothetical protein
MADRSLAARDAAVTPVREEALRVAGGALADPVDPRDAGVP